MNRPILFLHYTKNDYVYLSLLQAKKSNPLSDVFFLFHEKGNLLPDGVISIPISQFQTSSKILREAYVHVSPNSKEFEYRCLERWFILLEFCKKYKIKSFLYLDSDVLLFTQQNYFENVYSPLPKLSICYQRGPQYMFIGEIRYLEDLCKFILSSYLDKDYIEQLRSKYEIKQEGISDMTFFNQYTQSLSNQEVVDLGEIREGKTFDNNMNCSDGFEMEKAYKLKKVNWQGNLPYAKLLEKNEMVQFLGLHFQGKAKLYMHRYIKEKLPWDFRVRAEFKLLWNKLKVTVIN